MLVTGGFPSAPVERRWPFGELLAGTRIALGLCTVHSGTEMARIAALARSSPRDAAWRDVGGREGGLSVVVRPLLPEEAGCGDLGYPMRR